MALAFMGMLMLGRGVTFAFSVAIIVPSYVLALLGL